MAGEFTFLQSHIASLLGVSREALRDHLKRTGLIAQCVYQKGRMRIPLSVARTVLDLEPNAPIPPRPKIERRKGKRYTMQDVKKARQLLGGLIH